MDVIDLDQHRRSKGDARFEAGMVKTLQLIEELAAEAGLEPWLFCDALLVVLVSSTPEHHQEQVIDNLRRAANLLARERRKSRHPAIP